MSRSAVRGSRCWQAKGGCRAYLRGTRRLRSTFSNIPQRAKALVNRWNRGVHQGQHRGSKAPVSDARGPLVRRIETAQTFLTASEIDSLVGGYLAGATVQELAQKYGIHRATVFAHLRRRNTPRRVPGLDVDGRAEAVRLFRAGVSMRASARRLGVGRQAVRRVLDEAGAIWDSERAATARGPERSLWTLDRA